MFIGPAMLSEPIQVTNMETITTTLEPLELRQYLEWVNGGIRIAGTRIGLEQIVEAYDDGATPEEIALRYRALSLEEVYATITYYLANHEQVKTYMRQLQMEDKVEWSQSGQPSLTKLLRERLETQYETMVEEDRLLPSL